MILELPLTNVPAYKFVTQLGDRKFRFRFAWNDRNGTWNFDLYNADTDALIVGSLTVCLGADLLAPYAFGIGALYALDTLTGNKPAALDDLGTRVKMYWASEDEKL